MVGEHGLPPEYIAKYIQSVEAIEDPSNTRDKTQRDRARQPRAIVSVRVANPKGVIYLTKRSGSATRSEKALRLVRYDPLYDPQH